MKTKSRTYVLYSFGDSPGLSSDVCSGPCPLGHYCPIQSTLPTPCPAGRALFIKLAVALYVPDISIRMLYIDDFCMT